MVSEESRQPKTVCVAYDLGEWVPGLKFPNMTDLIQNSSHLSWREGGEEKKNCLHMCAFTHVHAHAHAERQLLRAISTSLGSSPILTLEPDDFKFQS